MGKSIKMPVCVISIYVLCILLCLYYFKVIIISADFHKRNSVLVKIKYCKQITMNIINGLACLICN